MTYTFDAEALNLFEDQAFQDQEYLGDQKDLVSEWSLHIEEDFDNEVKDMLESF